METVFLEDDACVYFHMMMLFIKIRWSIVKNVRGAFMTVNDGKPLVNGQNWGNDKGKKDAEWWEFSILNNSLEYNNHHLKTVRVIHILLILIFLSFSTKATIFVKLPMSIFYLVSLIWVEHLGWNHWIAIKICRKES